MVNKMSEALLASSDLKGFLYISVGDKETDQMIGGFNRLVDVQKSIVRNNSGGLLTILLMQFIRTTLSFPPQKVFPNGGSI